MGAWHASQSPQSPGVLGVLEPCLSSEVSTLVVERFKGSGPGVRFLTALECTECARRLLYGGGAH